MKKIKMQNAHSFLPKKLSDALDKISLKYAEKFKLRALIQAIPWVGGPLDTMLSAGGIRLQRKRDDERLERIEKATVSPSVFENGVNRIISEIQKDDWERIESIVEPLLQEKVEKIAKLIQSGKLSDAEKFIDELYSRDYEKLPQEIKARLHVQKGSIYLQRGNIEKAKEFVRKALAVKEQKRAFDLMASIAVILGNNVLQEEAIAGMKRCGAPEVDITLTQLQFESMFSGPEVILRKLSTEDDLKNEFKNIEGALHLAGVAALRLNRFELAYKWLAEANELRPTLARKYLITLSRIMPILNRPGAFYLKSEQDKRVLSDALKAFISIEEVVVQQDDGLVSEYWTNRISVHLYLDISSVEEIFKKLPKRVQENDNVQLVYADALYLTDRPDVAKAIYERLYMKKKSPELLLKLVGRLFGSERYDEIIRILEKIPYEDYDNEGRLAAILIDSIDHLKGPKAALEKASEIESSFGKGYALFEIMAKIHHKQRNSEVAETYIKKMIASLPSDNFPPRLMLAKTCEMLRFPQYAIEILDPFQKYAIRAKIYLIDLLSRTGDEKNLKRADKMVDELIESGEETYNAYCLKANMAMDKGDMNTALKAFRKAFDKEKSIYAASNIVAISLNANNLEGIIKYIKFLRDSNDAQGLIMAATGYNAIGERSLAEIYGFKALSLLGEDFNERVYLQFLWLHFPGAEPKDFDKGVKLSEIIDNAAVRLVDEDGKERWICIDSEKDIISQPGQIFIGCEHYLNNSSQGVSLLGTKLNTEVQFENKSYKIAEIITRTARAVRYCLNTFTQERPESPYLRAITGRRDELIEKLIPRLQESYERAEFLMAQYNYANGIGLPIYAVADKDSRRYLDTILRLFELPKQIFYAGSIIDENIKERPMILTLSSLMIIRLVNQHGLLKEIIDNFHVSKKLVDGIEYPFNEARTIGMKTMGSVSIDSMGKPVFIPFDDKQKMGRVNFYRDIMQILGLAKTHKNVEKKNIESLLHISEMIGEFEVDGIFLAKELDGILVSDDDFVHRTAKMLFPDIRVTNSVSILNSLLESDLNTYVRTIKHLSEQKYKYCCTSLMIFRMAQGVVGTRIITPKDDIESNFLAIISNLMDLSTLFRDYLPILRGTLFQLYKHRVNPAVERIIRLIINRIKASCKRYGITLMSLKRYFTEFAGLDVAKAKYFSQLIEKA